MCRSLLRPPSPGGGNCWVDAEVAFRRSAEWLWLKEHDPKGLTSAVAFDEALRDEARMVFGWDRPAYLHDSRRPLAEVIPELEVLAEAEASQGDLFADHGLIAECAGYCGV